MIIILYGSSGNDHIMSGELTDLVVGNGGTDWIEGGNGNDYLIGDGILEGGAGSDILYGGNGNDQFYGDAKIDTATAIDNGNTDSATNLRGDWLSSGSGNDTLVTGAGNDVLAGGGGNDLIIAGAGDDIIFGDASYTAALLMPGGTPRYSIGSADFYSVSPDTFNWGYTYTNNHLAFTSTVVGDPNPADSGNDVIYAGDGADKVWAGAGDDIVYGEAGDDLIAGEAGNDILSGGDGNDTVWGGDGNDYITGDAGNDILYGDSGNGSGAQGNDYMDGGDGNDTLYGEGGDDILLGGAGDDKLYGGSGANYLDGGDGNDILNSGGPGSELYGGAGDDNISAAGGGNYLDGEDGNDTLTAVDGNNELYGGAGDDNLSAGGGNNYLDGGDGNNMLAAFDGNNTLMGGTGDDNFSAGGGENYLDGGDGKNILAAIGGGNTLFAGTGNDTLSAGGGNNYLDGGDGNNTLIADGGYNTLFSGSGDDTLSSTGGNSYLDGGDGNNTLTADGGGNTLIAGAGDDTLSATGGNNYLDGGDGNNTLIASGVNNTLVGGAGNDTFQGGSGNDTFIGGGGLDTYLMGYGSGSDVVIDSSSSGGVVQLGPDVTLDDMSVSQQGNDLLLKINGTNDSIRVKDYYTSPQATWTIRDSQGNSNTSRAIHDAVANQSAATKAENSWLSQTKGEIISSAIAAGGWGGSGGSGGSGIPEDGTNHTGLDGYFTTFVETSFAGTPYATTKTYTEGGIDNIPWSAALNSSYIPEGLTTVTVNGITSGQGPSIEWLAVNWVVLSSETETYQNGNTSTIETIQHANGYGTSITLTNPGILATTGIYPKYVPILLGYYNINIDQTNLDGSGQAVQSGAYSQVISSSGNDTIYNAGFVYTGSGNDTVVNAGIVYGGSGDNVIENAGTAYGGTGNDTMLGGGTLVAGSGNDLLIGGSIMVAGSGNDQIFAGSGNATIQIDPNSVSSDIIGGAGTTDFLDVYYQSMSISDWQGSYQHANMYDLQGVWFSDEHSLLAAITAAYGGDWSGTVQDAIQGGIVTYCSPLPVLFSYMDGLPPSPYYAANNVPVVNLPTSANDFQALAPYYDQGILSAHTVAFGAGVLPNDLQLSWGQTAGSISGLSTDLQLKYTTLNISWGTNGQSIQVMIPHTNDPLGSGVSGFTFAEGPTLTMAQMIAMAPPAPSFDPGVFVFKQGMGAQVVDSSDSSMLFGAGITAGNVQFFQQGADLLVKDGTWGDSALIQNFAPNGVTGNQTIGQYMFADGSSGTYIIDGQGNANMDAYDASGNLVGDFWQNSYGYYGNDTYRADGSSSGLNYNPDGSYYTYAADGNGTYNELDYAADGTLTGDYWEHPDGSNGDDTFNADGSSSGNTYNADGSYSNYINNGQGDVTTRYFNSNYILQSYSVLLSDGHGNGTLTNYDANGNVLDSTVTTNDGLGDTTTTYYDANANKLSDSWTKGDGTSGNDTFNTDGSLQTADILFGAGITAGNTQFFQQGADLLVKYGTQGDSVLIQNFMDSMTGSQGSTQFQFTDGSQGSYATDGQGNTNMNAYDIYGNWVGDFWQNSDGSYGNETSDGSSSGLTYNPDGSYYTYIQDTSGNYFELDYSATGSLVYDYWSKSNGSNGSDTFNTDGSSSGYIYNANGSQSSYTDDGQGDVTTTYFDTNGLETGYSISTNDGFGNTSLTNYDSNGNKLNDSWTHADGSTGSDIFNVDGTGVGIADDGYGNTTTINYDANNHNDSWTKTDGSSGSDVFDPSTGLIISSTINAGLGGGETLNGNIGQNTFVLNLGDGHNVLIDSVNQLAGNGGNDILSFGTGITSKDVSFQVQGADVLVTYSPTDSILIKNFDLFGINGMTTPFGSYQFADGSSIVVSVGDNWDGPGSYGITQYNPQNIMIEDQWAYSGGSYGTDTFNADGSVSGISHQLDGSYNHYSWDAQNNYMRLDYNSSGVKVSDWWSMFNGPDGWDTFNIDGSSSGESYNSDGSYSSYTNNGHGDITTTSYDLFNNVLGYSTTINDGHGDVTTNYYDTNGNLQNYSVLVGDGNGNGTLTNYDTNGNVFGSISTSNDGLGNTTITNFDANGNKLSDSWTQANGTTGSDTFNSDGSVESKVNYIYADGSTYSIDTVNDPNSSYQQSWSNSAGNSGSTNYNALTGEVTGSNAMAYTYTYDNTQLGGGVTESKVDYTYADGSTYSTDTVNNPNGSYQQSWSNSQGSHGSTDYNAATGEVIGSNATAGAGYSYTYDNTQNVGGVSGVTESKVAYTYADGSTYATDTVSDPNGSYQQSWNNSAGSHGSTDYNAVTGEVIGSNATAGAGYSYTYDNTQNVGGVAGVTESKVDYTYADGSTYSTDTVSDPDGSYQQSWSNSAGSSGSTDYNAVTGEVIGSNATVGAGYSYTYDNTQNVGGVSGVTESKVDYTYIDGSTYSTDTVSDPDGSYQQSWSNSTGSSGSTDYNAVTGEVIGSNATAGAGYSYTYDNTQNVGGVAGVTESQVDYTYADGTTYSTDTISDPNGSYQQSWSNSQGSHGSTDYNSVTGEVIGSNATAGAGYSYTYDNTQNVGGVAGVTESKVDYTYTDGSTYNTDTESNPDGSYFQGWNKSDGTAGSSAVNASGTLAGDSWVHADGNQGVDAGSNHLMMGGSGTDALAGATGSDLIIGGRGNDSITTGSGIDIIAFNKGDGQDVVNAVSGQNNTISLGGNYAYNDLALQKNGNDLVLDVGSTDSITFKDWYAGAQNIVDLQVIASSMSDFNAGSTDVLRNSNVENFDFQALVSAFDQAQAANPTLTAWGVTDSLLNAHLASSDTAALGGDLAYVYGTSGNLTGFGVSAAESTLSSSQFAAAPQTLNPWPTLNTGTAKII